MKKINETRESLVERYPDMKDQILKVTDTAIEIAAELEKLTNEEIDLFIRFLKIKSRFPGKNEGF